MSYITERYNIGICPNRGLSVVQCGWQKCDPCHQNGPVVYPYYSITFILRGQGCYTTKGISHNLHAGEGFIILPGVSSTTTADAEAPWEYIYAVFLGTDTTSMLWAAGLDSSHVTFSYNNDTSMRDTLDAMRNAGRSSSTQGYDVLGYFYLCMSRLIHQQTLRTTPENAQELYISKSVAYIQTNYPYNISITDVADYVGIDRSYLYRLFVKYLSTSPHSFLLQYRLSRAEEMLKQTSYSITEIACSVGFYDVSHFSKAFHQQYQCSPYSFRTGKIK